MRILEETKEYIIYYNLTNHCDHFGAINNIPQIIQCVLLDKQTKYEHVLYGNPLKVDVCTIGRLLIKKWREKNDQSNFRN